METLCVRIKEFPVEVAQLFLQAKTEAARIWIGDLKKLYAFWDNGKSCTSFIMLSK